METPAIGAAEQGSNQRGIRAGLRRSTLALISLEVLLAVGAIGGAYVMFEQGDGAFGGAITARDLPWQSWTVVAVSLVVLIAVVPMVVALAAWTDEPLARSFGHFLVAIILTGWIGLEVMIVGWISWLQPALLAYAAVIAVLAVVDQWRSATAAVHRAAATPR